MSIEVKQMTVKSNFVQSSKTNKDNEESGCASSPNREKNQILDECRRMIAEALSERREY